MPNLRNNSPEKNRTLSDSTRTESYVRELHAVGSGEGRSYSTVHCMTTVQFKVRPHARAFVVD